jgi:FtsP/CotA-like multicopper oxidase with cupredoxin domain
LRLINVANARIFSLDFGGHKPMVVALDGHPIEPHVPSDRRVTLGPGARADIVLDCTGKPEQTYTIFDRFYERQQYRLIDLVYSEAALRDKPLGDVVRLAPNPVAEPDVGKAVRHIIEFGGGMMDPKMRRMAQGERMGMMHDMRERMQRGSMWSINGVFIPPGEHAHEPFLKLDHGTSYVFDMQNDTAWWHPMHLHGHIFRVLSRNGAAAHLRERLDTVLMAPGERVEIAFVADNPGDWMFHCHILEHMQAGMMGTIRVA